MERRFYDSAGAEAEPPTVESYGTNTPKARRPRRELLLAGIGVCLVVVVMALFWFREEAPSTEFEDRIQKLERRLQNLEQVLNRLNGVDERLGVMENRLQQLAVTADRFDRFESTLNSKMDAVARELAAMKSTKTVAAPAATKPPPAAERPGTAAAQHVVQPGETLYAIARRYGLTIDELRKANGIGADNTIHPGQKLIIHPKSSP
jgi:LysM repeat protein